MIYLIDNIEHELQHNRNCCVSLFLRNKFSVFLKNKIKEYNIDLLAEEFNEDCFKNSNKNISTAQAVVKDLKYKGLKIEHRFCEMSKKERKSKNILTPSEIYSQKLNIRMYRGEKPNLDKNQQKIFDTENKKSFLVREAFWFDKIKNDIDKHIIFICGNEHIKSFKFMLENNKIKITVLKYKI